MQDPNFLNDTAIVLLNYMTTEEPLEMLASCKSYYPNIRVVIVDNGSPKEVVEKLSSTAKKYKSVSVLPLRKNTGFACGHNTGIEVLRKEGYQYICCSNSDIKFTKKNVLETLKWTMLNMNGALAGPRIKIPEGRYLRNPPQRTPKTVSKIYDMYNHPWKYTLKYYILNDIAYRLLKKMKSLTLKHVQCAEGEESVYPVYQIRGAFLMMGPLFFKHYSGFDPNTFLYGEESILTDMALLKNLNIIKVDSTEVFHGGQKTSKLLWRESEDYEKLKHRRNSFNYWFNNYYKKYPHLIEKRAKKSLDAFATNAQKEEH